MEFKFTAMKLKKGLSIGFLVAGSVLVQNSHADILVHISKVGESGSTGSIGTISLKDTLGGLEVMPNLHGLSEGAHGFHVHQNNSCAPQIKDGVSVPALAAGGHFDPEDTNIHAGPNGHGHTGDMPVLMVDSRGIANQPVIVPRLTESMVKNRSIIIHAGGDNYSDKPLPLGGGGARLACGLIL